MAVSTFCETLRRGARGVTLLATLTTTSAFGAYGPPTPDPYAGVEVTTRSAPGAVDLSDYALELRLGALVPAQILDGADLHLRLGWRRRLIGVLWAHAESGFDRTRITALTSRLEAPGGAATVRADQTQWTIPALLGLTLQQRRSAGPTLGLALSGGAVYSHATLETAVIGGQDMTPLTDQRLEWMVAGRAEVSWYVGWGDLLLSTGWQQVLKHSAARRTGDVHASGLLLEAGWRGQL